MANNVRSILKGKDELAVRLTTGLHPQVLIQIPNNQCANKLFQGWAALHMYPFYLRFRLPFPKLVMSFLQTYKLPPSQLQPQVWQILYIFSNMNKAFNVNVDVGMVMSTYSISVGDTEVISLGNKEGFHPFLWDVNTEVDELCASKFFFVNVESASKFYGDLNYFGVPWCTDAVVLSKEITSPKSNEVLQYLVQCRGRGVTEVGSIDLEDDEEAI